VASSSLLTFCTLLQAKSPTQIILRRLALLRVLKLVEAVTVDFEALIVEIEPWLRRAFVARYGWPAGLDITAEAVEWAWAHRDEVAAVANPTGYLYRVGMSKSRRLIRWRKEQGGLPSEIVSGDGAPWSEPELPTALNRLKPDDRSAIVLVHCFQWSYAEVAELLDVPVHTVRNRIHRGMQSLRIDLGVNNG
jgi:RNA polymerase sigma factor (sigma-70 family)